MAQARSSDGERSLRRLWSFADCVFDEANWTLAVGGNRVQVELKPLELLRELLLQSGNLVSKEDLLSAIWPDVMVVEASLPTAVRKLRLALNDDQRPVPIIETVSRIGYRLSVPVTVEARTGAANAAIIVAAPAEKRRGMGGRRLLSIAGLSAIAIGAAAFALTPSAQAPAPMTAPSFSQEDAVSALRRLDVSAIERMLAAGWNPNAPIGGQGNRALHFVIEMCEWNPAHDRRRLLLMVRTLHDGGALYEGRNMFGDTPYSIAKSPRYCGPDHPVTQSIRATCFQGLQPLGDRCLAAYEVARRRES